MMDYYDFISTFTFVRFHLILKLIFQIFRNLVVSKIISFTKNYFEFSVCNIISYKKILFAITSALKS